MRVHEPHELRQPLERVNPDGPGGALRGVLHGAHPVPTSRYIPPIAELVRCGAVVATVATFAALALSMGCMDRDTPQKVAQAFQAGAAKPDEKPRMLNAELPFHYPPALYAQKVQGNVTLYLHIDRDGQVRPDSTRIEESSGYAALDSAAVNGIAGAALRAGEAAWRADGGVDALSRVLPSPGSACAARRHHSQQAAAAGTSGRTMSSPTSSATPAAARPFMRNARPYESVLDTIGWTPLIRLTRITRGVRTPVYGKAEFFNPGGSVKDRIGMPIIEQAEREGRLKPGGTIVEGTSGNTGVGLAIAAALKGYKCIFTMPDKMSQEKVRLLKAFGAEVIITPTAVPPDHPDNYVMMAKRIAEETPNAILANQFYNQANPDAHYATTGPELWEQTEGRITHFVAAAGTGGTITGVGRYLKEQNPNVKIISGDPQGSVLAELWRSKGAHMGDGAPYKVEGSARTSCRARSISPSWTTIAR